MTIKLSQTVAGNWVITVPNPEERCSETQLAEFNMDSVSSQAKTLMESVMISMFASFIQNAEEKDWEVVSSNYIITAGVVGLVQQKLQQDQQLAESVDEEIRQISKFSSGANSSNADENGWISVKDEKPKDEEIAFFATPFLAFCEDDPEAKPFPCILTGGRYLNLSSVDRYGDYYEASGEVTHWKPIGPGPAHL